jgi:SAM-dependent methyltransferase
MNSAVTQTDTLRGAFPVPLICPKCSNAVEPNSLCAQTGRPCMEIYHGMPRFLFGQRYWGETSSDKMRQLLQEAAATSWRAALHTSNDPIAEHLLSPIRADFLHAMPWNRIRNVLDIGAGMGFMSCDMALYADSVVAVEAVPERAEFIQIRARQDNLKVFPIIASAVELPFTAASFDLVTLNGVFEYLGLWGDGNPKELQQQFLRNAFRLLRPGGYLYVGIETRYASTAFLGHRDHSGLAFTSLMPRRLADLYCRIRARPFYGSEHVVKGYRTYTYTPLQYAKMFRRAGFCDVYVQGVFEGYNKQRVLYGIDDYAGRKTVLGRINPPASVAGVVRRLFTDNRVTYRTLETEVVIFAQKASPSAGGSAMPWTEVCGPHQTVVQVNQAGKTLAIICDKGAPVEILEAEKEGDTGSRRRLERSFEILQTLQDRLKAELPSLPMRWPIPRGTVCIAGRTYRRYEYIHGHTLATRLLPLFYDDRAVLDLFAQALRSYVSLCSWMSACLRDCASDSNWTTLEEQLTGIEVGDDIRQDFRLAVAAAANAGWQLSAIHGDFTASNLLVTPSNNLVLVDWEHTTPAFPIGADLVRFLQDATIEAARLRARARGRFRYELRQIVNATLESCGYTSKDYPHLQALYIGQQIAAHGGESRVFQPLLEAYRAGRQLNDPAQRDE